MHYFQFKGKELFAEDIPVKRLAQKFGTPLYIYKDEEPPHPSELAGEVKKLLKGRNLTLIVEPADPLSVMLAYWLQRSSITKRQKKRTS